MLAMDPIACCSKSVRDATTEESLNQPNNNNVLRKRVSQEVAISPVKNNQDAIQPPPPVKQRKFGITIRPRPKDETDEIAVLWEGTPSAKSLKTLGNNISRKRQRHEASMNASTSSDHDDGFSDTFTESSIMSCSQQSDQSQLEEDDDDVELVYDGPSTCCSDSFTSSSSFQSSLSSTMVIDTTGTSHEEKIPGSSHYRPFVIYEID